ncbi:hypothetical protein GCM10028807_04900 [Spirosoma daeguense]
MKTILPYFFLLFGLTMTAVLAQPPVEKTAVRISSSQPKIVLQALHGYFLTDSIEIGRPFQYSLTYRHPTKNDVLFPDTAKHFAPYRVQNVATFTTQTVGTGRSAISRDSAVYTLVSFETDSVQLLRVPVRILNAQDCTAQWTQTDTVFLRSKLPVTLSDSSRRQSLKLATSTALAPVQQEFNYMSLGVGVLAISFGATLLYALFGRSIRRQWRLYKLNRQHVNFHRNYTRLINRLNAYTAADTANQAIVMWKAYLELIDTVPYTAMTTPELAEQLNDERITNALREADQMIYGGTFSLQSHQSLQVLSDVATQTYYRSRSRLLRSNHSPADKQETTDSVDTPTF